jgi:hypothetical protein
MFAPMRGGRLILIGIVSALLLVWYVVLASTAS